VHAPEAEVAEPPVPTISFSIIERVDPGVERVVGARVVQHVDGVVHAALDEGDDLARRQRPAEVGVRVKG